MKIFLSLLLLLISGFSVKAATVNQVLCESDILKTQLFFVDNQFEAEVFQINSSEEWISIYKGTVNLSTTRGSNLLFLGENFGLGIATEKMIEEGRHIGTLRLWLAYTNIDQELSCKL